MFQRSPSTLDRRRRAASAGLTLWTLATVAALGLLRPRPADAVVVPDDPIAVVLFEAAPLVPTAPAAGGGAPQVAPRVPDRANPVAEVAPKPVADEPQDPAPRRDEVLPDPLANVLPAASAAGTPGTDRAGPGGAGGTGTDSAGPGVCLVDCDDGGAVALTSPLQAIRKVPPVYPAGARGLGLDEVRCTVRLDVDARGFVTRAQAVDCLAPFAPGAVAAAEKWRFTPARVGGERVPARFDLSIVYRLR